MRAVGEIYAREFRALGFETRWVDVPAEMKRAGHLVATHRGKHGGPRFLLIGHLDTVLQGEPFRRDGSKAYGTGSSDMKGGNLVALEALRALQATGELRDMNVTVVFTGDEEDPGSPQLVTRAKRCWQRLRIPISPWRSRDRRPARASSAAAASARGGCT